MQIYLHFFINKSKTSANFANPRVPTAENNYPHRMEFPHIKKNDGCHFCVETSFLLTKGRFLEGIYQ